MTTSSFHEIPLGSTDSEVVSLAGKPYAIRKQSDGSLEYEYIERISAGGRDMEERHYYLLIKDGKVISKRMKQGGPTPYGFDSYEMQTTQGDHPQ